MAVHTITKGLNLPITGSPRQEIEKASEPRCVALMADDYVGMKPRFAVREGDAVKRGQLLFEDKKIPGVRFTAPAAGTLVAIHRGERRVLQSVVIELSEGERSGEGESIQFESFTGKSIDLLSRDEVKTLLLESGLWTSLRGRPFGHVADPEQTPHSIFVTAIDTNPLAASVDVCLAGQEEAFAAGMKAVAKLTDGVTYLCKRAGAFAEAPPAERIRTEEFTGVHPAGNVGLHIHLLDPVCRTKTVWYLNYQDVIAIGHLVTTGRLNVSRVISLAGPTVKNPRLLQTRIGVSIDGILAGELQEVENRVISGSVLSGREAAGDVFGYLGRYHLQVSVLAEGRQRELLCWLRPGLRKFSIIPAWLSYLWPERKYDFTTTTNGSDRAIVPIGMYERVMPMDIQPTFLLKSLVSRDIERAEQLGALELEEEDLALCTFVCPGKTEYGPILRDNLNIIEREG